MAFWGRKTNRNPYGTPVQVNELSVQISSHRQISGGSVPTWLDFLSSRFFIADKLNTQVNLIESDVSDFSSFDVMEWHQYSFVYDARKKDMHVFIDTVLVGKGTLTGWNNLADSSTYLHLGYSYQSAPGYKDICNDYDEIQLFKSVKTKEQIIQLFNQNFVTKSKSSVASQVVSFPNPVYDNYRIHLESPIIDKSQIDLQLYTQIRAKIDISW